MTNRPPAATVPDGASRLDRMIARLSAQRAALETAAEMLAQDGTAGPVLEVGLGKGRTYSHLKKLFPDRRIFCLDGSVHAPPDAQPPAADLILGDFRETLAAPDWLPAPAALIHIDCGSEDRARDTALIDSLAPLLPPLLARGGIAVADREIRCPDWTCPAVDLPPDWPIFLYRATR